MSSFEFRAEIAPSGRAKCKSCKEALLKDVTRLGVKQVVDPSKAKEMEDRQRGMIEAMHWYHPTMQCFGTFRKTAKWWMENAPSIDEIEGFDDLDCEEREKIEKVVTQLRDGNVNGASAKGKAKGKAKASTSRQKAGKGKRKAVESSSGSEDEDNKRGDSGSDEGSQSDASGKKEKTRRVAGDQRAGKKRERETLPESDLSSRSESSSSETSREEGGKRSGEDSDNDSPKRRKTTTTFAKDGKSVANRRAKGKTQEVEADFKYEANALNSEKVTEIQEKGTKLMKKTLTQLKEMLKQNRQLLTGRKDELVTRIAEGQVLGALPKCAMCGGGTLKWNCDTGKYSCPGFYDDDAFHRCNWKGNESDVDRKPWISA